MASGQYKGDLIHPESPLPEEPLLIKEEDELMLQRKFIFDTQSNNETQNSQ